MRTWEPGNGTLLYGRRVIDFKNASLMKLGEIDPQEIFADVSPLLIESERILHAFKTVRDYVVFTDRRLIAVNVQGITGKKRDYSSLPWAKVQAWSVETAGKLDLDSELELWFSGLGKVRLEFKGKVDIRAIGQLIGAFALR